MVVEIFFFFCSLGFFVVSIIHHELNFLLFFKILQLLLICSYLIFIFLNPGSFVSCTFSSRVFFFSFVNFFGEFFQDVSKIS